MKYIVIRTKCYEVVRFFESQRRKPVKVYYEDGQFALMFRVKARSRIEERLIAKILKDKARRIEKEASP